MSLLSVTAIRRHWPKQHAWLRRERAAAARTAARKLSQAVPPCRRAVGSARRAASPLGPVASARGGGRTPVLDW
jgi:hypothetical protein